MTVLKHPVVVIAGPTASGKSGLALDLAEALNGVVINADSMQIYQDTPIISAVPSAADKARVPHRLYEIFPADVNGSVVDWLNLAAAEIRSAWLAQKLPVVAGGTGLYLDNLINGTTPIPETSAAVRQEAAALLREYGVQALHEKLREYDPATAKRLSPNDTTRVRRAYEVWRDTGVPLSVWHRKPMVKKLPEASFVVIKIIPGREELDSRCYRRWEQMLAAGVLKEAAELAARKLDSRLPAMKALGVPELLAFVEGKCSLDEASAQAKLHTRQYAKRQMTWFKNKLAADIVLDSCYKGSPEEREKVIFDVKKRL